MYNKPTMPMKIIKHEPPTWKTELQKIQQVPLNEEPLHDQFKILATIGFKFGLYDAAEYLMDKVD